MIGKLKKPKKSESAPTLSLQPELRQEIPTQPVEILTYLLREVRHQSETLAYMHAEQTKFAQAQLKVPRGNKDDHRSVAIPCHSWHIGRYSELPVRGWAIRAMKEHASWSALATAWARLRWWHRG